MPARKVKGGWKIPHVSKKYKTKTEAEHVSRLREIYKHIKDK